MTGNQALEVLKHALLLEKKGLALYSQVAQQTTSPAAKEFFQLMASEEVKHCTWVEQQFANATKGLPFQSIAMDDSSLADSILTLKLRQEISAVSYEAAAISAAISLEENAIKIYSDRAATSNDPEERHMYETLTEFEKNHLSMLVKINSEITESVWHDNHFWPF